MCKVKIVVVNTFSSFSIVLGLFLKIYPVRPNRKERVYRVTKRGSGGLAPRKKIDHCTLRSQVVRIFEPTSTFYLKSWCYKINEILITVPVTQNSQIQSKLVYSNHFFAAKNGKKESIVRKYR